jgi:hypothetical protein
VAPENVVAQPTNGGGKSRARTAVIVRGGEPPCIPGKAGETGGRQKVVVSYRSYRRHPGPAAEKWPKFH